MVLSRDKAALILAAPLFFASLLFYEHPYCGASGLGCIGVEGVPWMVENLIGSLLFVLSILIFVIVSSN